MANIVLFQYQAHTEPVSTLPETVTESRWHQPWSEPKRVAQTVIAVALIASGLFSPVIQPPAEVINADKWFAQFREPVRVKPGLHASLQYNPNFTASPDPADDLSSAWRGPFNQPYRVNNFHVSKAPFLAYTPQPDPADDLSAAWIGRFTDPPARKIFPAYQQAALFFVAPSGEVTSADKWFAQFRDPVRRVAAATRSEQLSVDTDPVVTFSWFGQLRDPTRRIATATRYEQPSWSLFQTEVRDIGWFSPLSAPTLPKSRMAALSTRYQFINANYRMAWYQDLSKPTLRVRWTPTDQQSYPYFQQPTVAPDFGWFNGLSEPKKLKAKFVAADHEFENAFTALTFTIDWHAELSRPTLRVRPTPTDQQFYPYFPQPNAVVVDFGWFKGLQDPTRRLTRPIPDQYIGYPPITASFSWFSELRDPVRRIKPTPTDQQSYPYFPQPTGEVQLGWFGWLSNPTLRKTRPLEPHFFSQPLPLIVSYSWFGELRDPVRRIRPTPTDQQFYPYFPQPNVETSFGWFASLSDPSRRKPDVGPAMRVRYQFISSAGRSSWFRPLSEPTRRITSYDLLRDNADWVAVSTVMPWFGLLSEPKRFKREIGRGADFAFSPFPIPQTFTPGWTQPWPELVRRKPSVLQPYYAISLFPPTPSFGWYGNLSNPVRIKPRVKWLDEQSFQFPFVPTPGSWWSPWREPTPPKRRNPFFQPVIFTPTPPIIPSFGWYGSLAIPVRKPPKVWEGQYQAWEPKTINFEHLGYMAATEQHDFFLAVLRAFNPPLRAYVDIIEKDPRYRGNMGIIAPVPEDSIIASIVTPETIPATGTPVAAVRARVAIIVS